MSYSITYNGLDMNQSSNFHINKLEGLSSSEIRVSQDYKTGGHGGNIWNTLYGFRDIAIEGTINSPTVTDFFADRQKLINAFSITDNTDLGITLWDGATKYVVSAKVMQAPLIVDVAGKVTTTDFRVELRSGEPFISGDTLYSYDVALAVGGGTPVASPVPSPVGKGEGGSIIIANGGSIITYPTFTITGVVTNPTIVNVRTGQSFQVDTSLMMGDSLIVSYGTTGLFVLKNGASIRSLFTGSEVYLEFGNNEIIFNASNYSETANCNISFYEQYLGI